MLKHYVYRLIHRYLSLYIRAEDSVLEIHPQSDMLIRLFQQEKTAVFVDEHAALLTQEERLTELSQIKAWHPDYILLNGTIHYERDIQRLLENIHAVCEPATRILIVYYSSLWRPLLTIADRLKLRSKTPEQNWIAHSDIDNLLLLSDFEPVRRDQRILLPIPIPLLSDVVNRYCAPLPLFRWFTMLNILVARPRCDARPNDKPSVSVIVPARNEAGNLAQLVTRLPRMGPHDELIFVEGHSTDQTWAKMQAISAEYHDTITIKIARQEGKGKGDAVRKGFDLATKDILMILDADLTVPPEDLPKFYNALVAGKGEFINGSRLVYPMEEKAMRFFNILGNKFFAAAFSFVLGQKFKDTLCGTKVLSRTHYLKIAEHRAYFGDFDPFGDFDLLFGASRLGLKIVEIPIAYKERTYGETNIQRWKHGWLLLRMVMFAARKIEFI